MIDPDDLNVEDAASFERFAAMAERERARFRDVQARVLILLDQGEDAWSPWEFEFLVGLSSELSDQERTDVMIGLNPGQLRKLEELEERL